MADNELVDDMSIPDEASLWCRVPPRHFVHDDNLGRVRPSKAAFDDHPNGSPMSVVLADVVIESGRRPTDILAGHDGFALAAITAGLVRSKQQGIARNPLPAEPAHALVFGRKTGSVKKALAKGSQWVIEPPADSV